MPSPTLPLHPALAALLVALCLTAQAQGGADLPARGWLRYADGNTLSGALVARTPGGGVVRTDRFGDVRFHDGEARFEPEPAAAAAAAVPAPVPAAAQADGPGWRPASWSVGVSGYWQRKSDSTTSNLDLDVDATWKTPRDEVKLALSADYKVVDNDVDNNEQSGSLRWVRELHSHWVGLASLRLQRSTFTLDSLPTFDYLLVQRTLGVGWRQPWSADSHTLVAVNLEQISLELLRHHRRVREHATSLLLENHLRLGPRVHLDGTLLLYRWPDGDTGIDSSTELSYDLTQGIRVGLRHESRRNAVDLDVGRYNRLSLTTRVAF